jgi:hypothetical protein
MASRVCLYCQGPLGLRRLTGAQYCSEAHEDADRRGNAAVILNRLRTFKVRYHAALELAEAAEADRQCRMAEEAPCLALVRLRPPDPPDPPSRPEVPAYVPRRRHRTLFQVPMLTPQMQGSSPE